MTDPKTLPMVSMTKNAPDDLFDAFLVLIKYSLMFEIIWEMLVEKFTYMARGTNSE